MIRFLFPVMLILLSCQKNMFQVAAQPCKMPVVVNNQHPMKDSCIRIILTYTPGLTGDIYYSI
ncbi:MAG: hypothetical protein KA821_00125 [Chitinophagaceae bacterium]|nr:hypothetical protein [Chitinophagaceae bacterium]